MPSLNWFSLNRVDGGPSYFGNANRTSASLYWNDWLFGVVVTAAAFITVLLLLSPIYKHQWRTICLVTTSILMGGAFLLSLVMPWWQCGGPVSIRAPIRVQDTELMNLTLEVHVGLNYVNITLLLDPLQGGSSQKNDIVVSRLLPRDSVQQITGSYAKLSDMERIKFNERIELKTAEDMRVQFREALQRGLPVPILTVVNYLSHQEEGFRWSVDFRRAGYFCQFTLTLTLISWAWMNIFFLVIPHHGAIAMITTGLLALLAVFLYWILLPAFDLVININGSNLQFKLDGCYWTVLATGLFALLAGSILLILEIRKPGTLVFDLEIDSELKTKLINKVVQKRSVKLQPSVPLSPHKPSLKSKLSVIDATVESYAQSSITTSDTKLDSGFGISSDSISNSDTQFQMNSATDLEQIATMDGSYFKSSVTNLIQAEKAPKIYSYTFRHGRELPSFHESTISLHSETVHRYLDSIVEEDIVVHNSANSPPKTISIDSGEGTQRNSECSSDLEKEEWQDPVENVETARFHIDSDGHNDTFCSTISSATDPSPRRRSQRTLSIGSHRDIFGHTPKEPI